MPDSGPGEVAGGYFADYRKAVAQRVAAVEVCAPQRDRFTSTIAERRLGQLRLFRIQSDAVSITRSRRCIASDRGSQYIIALNTAGDCVVQHGHTELAVPANAFYLLDKTLPYETVFPGQSSRILIRVPRPLIDQRLADPGRFIVHVVEAEVGVARLAAEFVASLFREVQLLDSVREQQLAQICLDLIIMALATDGAASGEAAAGDASAARRMLISRIKAHVRSNLNDPELGPARICQATGISKRYLHQLFSESGTSVCGWIREQRLVQAHAALCNPRLAHMSVTAIAFDCGFSDTAHFSRVFKARFGNAPSRLRSDAARPG